MMEVLEETDDETIVENGFYLDDVDSVIMQSTQELVRVAENQQYLFEMMEDSGKGQKKSKFEVNSDNLLNDDIMTKLEDAEKEAKRIAEAIFVLKVRVAQLLDKGNLTEDETEELSRTNAELEKHMKVFEGKTLEIQHLVERGEIRERSKQNQELCNKMSKTGDKRGLLCSKCSEPLPSSITSFATKLAQSYSMQEKLAAENAELENTRYKLQEELLNKDHTLEFLQRELSNLQNEMRLVSRENSILNERLKKLAEEEEKQILKDQKRESELVDWSNTFQEYSENNYYVEKQLSEMEQDVKCLQAEISAVQQEREQLEKQRKIQAKSRPCKTPFLMCSMPMPCLPRHTALLDFTLPRSKYGAEIERTLKDDYDKLQELTKEAEEMEKAAASKVNECEVVMSCMRELSADQQQKLLEVKKRYEMAKQALEDQKMLIVNEIKTLEKKGQELGRDLKQPLSTSDVSTIDLSSDA